ncbi:MAG: SurA N-terminal domain-containing protein [Gammaproteobacteria bacterium]|nr:SurA N-terminal domain-containing protein [Gammaproteobacteria bacterium]
MLQAINDRIKGWLGIVIVVIIALPFAFWGISSYIGNGSEQYVAKINGAEISKREFDYNLSTQRQKLQQQFGGKLPFEEAVLKQQVLDQLINRKLLEEMADSAGYTISDQQLSENIKKIFTRDGKFDRTYIDQVLQSRGMSISQMESQLRSDMQISQLIDAVTNTSFITDSEARQLAALEHQQRKISTLVFSLDHFAADVEVTEDEIKTAYEQNSNRYMLPEKVSVEYVELKSDALASEIEIDEQAITRMYNDYVASISQKEQRKARHILLKTDSDKAAVREQLLDIKKQLEEGARFEDLARNYSQDVGSAKQGGDLGWIEPGQMVKPFEDALYALEVGEVSEVVESEYGLHLIKLEEVQSEPVASLEEKRAELEKIFKQNIVSNRFYELSEIMAATAYENPESLQAIVDALDVQPKTSEYFTRDSGTDIASHEEVRAAAFSKLVLDDKSNSDVIEISPEHIVVLRVMDREPASLLPLDSVRSAIERNVRLRKAHEKTLAAADEAKARINSGEVMVKDVVAEGVILETSEMLTRDDTEKADPAVLEAAFSMAAPEAGKVVANDVAMYSGDVALVVLEEVRTPDDISQAQIDAIKTKVLQDLSTMEFNTVLQAIRDKAELQINPKVIQ